jgi:hypothetical protein
MTDLGGVDVKFGEDAAESIAVDAQFFGGLALVASVGGQNFEDKATFEFADRFFVCNASGMHLGHKAVQLSLQGNPLSFLPVVRRGLMVNDARQELSSRLQPVRLFLF